jgi:hypothetical protein
MSTCRTIANISLVDMKKNTTKCGVKKSAMMRNDMTIAGSGGRIEVPIRMHLERVWRALFTLLEFA